MASQDGVAANRQEWGGKAGSDSAPIPVAAEPHLVRSCQLLRDAVKEACRLIWVEDAVWTKEGPAKLDKWVDTYGPLVGFKTDGGD